jgi:DNA-binding transcriptional LysR family regulator
LDVLAALQAARNTLRSHAAGGQDMIEFALPHTLAFTFFPHWLMELRARFGAVKSRLIALNVHDAVLRLTEGGCDLLIAYHHASQPLQLSPDRYEMLSLGRETLAPYAKAGADGRASFALPAPSGHAVPFLSYASGAYMARMVEWIAKTAPEPVLLDAIYETDMAEGLKAMALEGHGLAFLPASSVRKELASRRLVRAAPPGQYELTMEVRIYRERLDQARHAKPAAQALWAFLQADARAAASPTIDLRQPAQAHPQP